MMDERFMLPYEHFSILVNVDITHTTKIRNDMVLWMNDRDWIYDLDYIYQGRWNAPNRKILHWRFHCPTKAIMFKLTWA